MDLVAGQRRKKLQEALIDAFPQESLLEQMLLFELDKKLKVIVGSGNNLGEIIFILIQKAESEGWLTDLIRAAHTSNPGNLKLQDFVPDKVDDSQKYENFTEVNSSQAEQEVTCANQKNFVVNTSSKNYSIPLLKSIKLIEEHKYDGKLAVIEIGIDKFNDFHKIHIELTISFGNVEVTIPKINKFTFKKESIDVKFGIKSGELCFDLKNGSMPLSERRQLLNQDDNWRAMPVGASEAPVWQFELKNESSIRNELRILYGCLQKKLLGILELLEASTYCEIEAVFKISVNRNYIEIIGLDDGEKKKQKETKIGLLLRYLKPELENYVSKVAVRYEPADNS